MNCKPGDLAVIVRARMTPSAIGRIVRCVRLLSAGEPVDGFGWGPLDQGPCWLIEMQGGPVRWGADIVMRRAFADSGLRPIRDPGDDAQDETLNWLPVPNVKEPA